MGKCKNCKHWHQIEPCKDSNYDAPWCAYGVCGGVQGTEMISLYINDINLHDEVGEDARASLATRHDYGCVLFVKKAQESRGKVRSQLFRERRFGILERHQGGESYDSIAASLGVSTINAKSLGEKARKELERRAAWDARRAIPNGA